MSAVFDVNVYWKSTGDLPAGEPSAKGKFDSAAWRSVVRARICINATEIPVGIQAMRAYSSYHG
jgi:hypothetical protein